MVVGATDAIRDQVVHRGIPEDATRLSHPVLYLLVQSTAGSFALASLQRRLLSQVKLGCARRFPSMAGAVLSVELGVTMLDEHATL